MSERQPNVDQEHEPTTDVERIALGIAAAEQDERHINTAVAREIASQLHGGQSPALLAFASTGEIDKDRLGMELSGNFLAAGDDDEGERVKAWIVAFGQYLEDYNDRGPIQDWNERQSFDATYNILDRCTSCGAHISDPHNPTCEHLHETEPQQLIEIYVISLTDQDHGVSHGVWIDATQEPAGIQEDIDHMLRQSYFPSAEGWQVNDSYGFEPLNMEDRSVEDISIIGKEVEDHGEAFPLWLDHTGIPSVEDAANEFHGRYIGRYSSIRAYAEYILEERDELDYAIEDFRQGLPEDIRPYLKFDMDGYAESLENSHIVLEGNDGVYIFA